MSDTNLDLDELEEGDAEPEAAADAAKTTERGPGLFARIGQWIAAPFTRWIRWDALVNWRVAVIGAAVILLVWLLLANLSPVRIVLWFWVLDMPKAVAFVLDVALGALLMWLWIRHRSRAETKEKGEPDE